VLFCSARSVLLCLCCYLSWEGDEMRWHGMAWELGTGTGDGSGMLAPLGPYFLDLRESNQSSVRIYSTNGRNHRCTLWDVVEVGGRGCWRDDTVRWIWWVLQYRTVLYEGRTKHPYSIHTVSIHTALAVGCWWSRRRSLTFGPGCSSDLVAPSPVAAAVCGCE